MTQEYGMTDPEAVNRENDWWSNPRLEPILKGIYEDDMGDGYAKRLAARTALVELERERAALVAERARNQRKVDAYDAARAVVKIEGDSRAYYVLRAENAEALAEQAVAERDEAQSRERHSNRRTHELAARVRQAVAERDAAVESRIDAKIATNAAVLAERQAVAERDRYRDALKAAERVIHGPQSSHILTRNYEAWIAARAALAVSA